MRNKAFVAFIVGSLILISASLACSQSPTRVSRPQAPSPTPSPLPSPSRQAAETPLPTLAPPLARVDFPEQVISYPPDWPDKLRYPEEFLLVEALTGTLPGGKQAWTTKLRFKGDPKSAAASLTTFLTSQGWQVERTDLDSGGVLLKIEGNEKGSAGVIDLDADAEQSTETKVLAAIFL